MTTHYSLCSQSDPSAALEESLISILIAIARHSPTCAEAIMKCERLVQVIVHRFTTKDQMGVDFSKIKSVILMKVFKHLHNQYLNSLVNDYMFVNYKINTERCKDG